MKKCFFFIISILFISVNLIGQVDKELELYKLKYPDEDAVSISISMGLEVSIKNNKPIITETCKEESILLSKRSAALSTNQVGHSSFIKILESEAFTLVPDNNKYKKMDVKEIRKVTPGYFMMIVKLENLFFLA